MRAIVQRAGRASVRVDGEVVGSIGQGLCVLVGVTHDDTEVHALKLADKLWKLRIFADADDKMNLSVGEVGGEILVISQFTLYGDARKGNRPSYIDAARPEVAAPLIEIVCAQLGQLGAKVQAGVFGADMEVTLLNDGPVTISLEV